MATSYRSETTIYKRYKIEYSKDSFAILINQTNAFRQDIHFTNNSIDTVNVFLNSDFCRSGFDLYLIVEQVDTNETILFISNAEYDCPKEDDDREKIIEAFENLVIDQL